MRFSRYVGELFVFVVILVALTSLSSFYLLSRVVTHETTAADRRLGAALDQVRALWQQLPWDQKMTVDLGALASARNATEISLAVRLPDSLGQGRWHYLSGAASSPARGAWDSVSVTPPAFAGTGWHSRGDYWHVVMRAEQWDGAPVIARAAMVSPRLGLLQRLMRTDLYVRGFFLAAFGVFCILFYRLILLPFRDMRKRAASLARSDILPSSLRSEDEDAEYVMATFDELVRRLSAEAHAFKQRAVSSERRARDLERFNEYMLASMSTGVLIVGPDERVMRLNRAAEGILHAHSEDVVGRDYRSAGFYPEMIAIIEEGLRDQFEYSRREVRVETHDPIGPSYLGINTSLIRNDDNTVIGLSILLTDLTEIKRLYDDLAENQRLADLGEMAAGLAHQLRNSLAAIVGYGKLLRSTAQPGTQTADWVEWIVKETDETSAMLTRFLDFARPLKSDLSPLDPSDVIREATDAMSEFAERQGVRVLSHTTVTADQPTLHADPLLLKQVLINLLQNAIEAMPEGGEIIIGQDTIAGPDKHRHLRISVSDTGCGVPADAQDRIFQPFFTSKDTGTGLGLPLAKKICIIHGGNLTLDHSGPTGTRFTVTLPLEPASPLLPPDTAIADTQPAEPKPAALDH
jgi:signal transduction histidine kinase